MLRGLQLPALNDHLSVVGLVGMSLSMPDILEVSGSNSWGAGNRATFFEGTDPEGGIARAERRRKPARLIIIRARPSVPGQALPPDSASQPTRPVRGVLTLVSVSQLELPVARHAAQRAHEPRCSCSRYQVRAVTADREGADGAQSECTSSSIGFCSCSRMVDDGWV